MHVGVYHLAGRRVAFRNDYCRTCDAPRLATRVRSFAVLNIFWIPLIPLGFRHRWFCVLCGRPPHESTRTRHGYKIAGVVVLVLMSVGFWYLPMEEMPNDEGLLWSLRIGSPLLLVWSLYHLGTTTREPDHKEKLAGVEPYLSSICPFCQGSLFNAPTWHCPTCKLERM